MGKRGPIPKNQLPVAKPPKKDGKKKDYDRSLRKASVQMSNRWLEGR